MAQSIILTAAAIAIGIALYAFGGWLAFAFYALTLPVALFLLWMARDVQSWEEKWAPSRPRAALTLQSTPKGGRHEAEGTA